MTPVIKLTLAVIFMIIALQVIGFDEFAQRVREIW